MVEIIQQTQKTNSNRRAIHIHGWMEHNLAGYAKYYLMETHKFQKVVNSLENLVIVKEFFLDIGKQMLETSYTLNLG